MISRNPLLTDARLGANHMDGVVGITQRAIAPGESFAYDFVIDTEQSGTFW